MAHDADPVPFIEERDGKLPSDARVHIEDVCFRAFIAWGIEEEDVSHFEGRGRLSRRREEKLAAMRKDVRDGKRR